MKVRVGVLLIFPFLHSSMRSEERSVPVGQERPNSGAEKAAQESVWELSAEEARKAYEQAQVEVERAWKIATQIRERDGIIDAAPHRESGPVVRSGKADDLQAYLAAKRIYLKANADCYAKSELANEARTSPRENARAKAAQTYKAAATLRQEFEIIDQDPESDGVEVTSLSGNGSDVKAYLAAKAEYVKAKAELDKFTGFECRITEKDLEVMMRRRPK
jgi:hypothetical protein